MTGLDDGAHFVEIEYDKYGGPPLLHFTCTATTSDAPCHQDGECQVIAWLNEGDADECLIDDTSVKVPIAYDWHGEGVDWKFAISEARR